MTMKSCTDKRYQQLIHAYELSMLAEDQRREFETHLLECDACFEEVRDFQEASLILNHDAEPGNLVAQIDNELADEKRERRTVGRRVIWPLTFAAAAILVILVFLPWYIEIRPTQEAVAANNRLLVMNFADPLRQVGSDSLAFVIANLLIADLTQQGVDVVSSLRLYEISRALGRSDPTQLDWGMAREVASRARANWILLGTILSPPTHPSVSVELVEASSGNVAAGFTITALDNEGLFDVMDRLSEQVGTRLAPQALSTPSGPSVAQVTSPSLDAYWFYLRGIDEHEKLHYDRAIASFQRALELDPEMPMAYYYLARLLDRSLITKALENLDRASREEQSYIKAWAKGYEGKWQEAIEELHACVQLFPDSRQAWYLLARYTNALGRTPEAIEYFQRALALDSTSKTIYNELAYCYAAVSDSANAIRAAKKYVELEPDEANPYDTQGEILARFGLLREAITAFERALEIDPGWYHSRSYLGFMYTFDGQYSRADSIFRQLIFQSNPALRRASLLYAVYPLLRQAKFSLALTELDKLIRSYESPAEARAADPNDFYARQLRAMILEEIGRRDEAIDQMLQCLSLAQDFSRSDSSRVVGYCIRLLSESGNRSEVDRLVDERLKFSGDSSQPDPIASYLSGMAALGYGQYDNAVRLIEQDSIDPDDFFGRVSLAKAYLGAGRLPEAEEALHRLAGSYTSPRSYQGIESVKLHYYLGLVLEQMNRAEEAIEQYRAFISIWEQAQPETASLADARKRLEILSHAP